MKKQFLTIMFLFVVMLINAQSLEDIINKYAVANKLDHIAGFKTIKITSTIKSKVLFMRAERFTETWMKNPDKIKTVTSVNGQDVLQVFDGEKGYTIIGSKKPVEMTSEQMKDFAKNNLFQNYMINYLKNGQLALEGEDNVNGKPAFKLKVALGGGNNSYMYIDKDSFLLEKTVAFSNNKRGMIKIFESYLTDYTETNGILLPMKTTTTAGATEDVTTITKVEFDIQIDDRVFKAK
jgi:outer membrane lipoprotein-sorting protein